LARSAEFDLAVLDINVGGYNIAPIAQIIADRDLPFIFVSGYGLEGRPQSFPGKAGIAKAAIPGRSLAKIIEKALADRPAVT
jgi:hypothetical protein